jgi:hypothetical protein
MHTNVKPAAQICKLPDTIYDSSFNTAGMGRNRTGRPDGFLLKLIVTVWKIGGKGIRLCMYIRNIGGGQRCMMAGCK